MRPNSRFPYQAAAYSEAPQDCQCGEWNADLYLPCWECYRAGFDERNPDPPKDDDGRDVTE